MDTMRILKECAVELQRLRDVHLPKYEGKVGEPDADVLKRAKEFIKLNTGHPLECPWHEDWHACNCGALNAD